MIKAQTNSSFNTLSNEIGPRVLGNIFGTKFLPKYIEIVVFTAVAVADGRWPKFGRFLSEIAWYGVTKCGNEAPFGCFFESLGRILINWLSFLVRVKLKLRTFC